MAKERVAITMREMESIREKKKSEKNVKIYKRLLFLEMKGEKKKNKEIASLIDVRVETLSCWTSIYKEQGLSGLCMLHYEGRRPGVLTPFSEDIKKHVEQENVSRLQDLRQWISEKYNISVGIAWIQRFCKKNSIFLTRRQD